MSWGILDGERSQERSQSNTQLSQNLKTQRIVPKTHGTLEPDPGLALRSTGPTSALYSFPSTQCSGARKEQRGERRN